MCKPTSHLVKLGIDEPIVTFGVNKEFVFQMPYFFLEKPHLGSEVFVPGCFDVQYILHPRVLLFPFLTAFVCGDAVSFQLFFSHGGGLGPRHGRFCVVTALDGWRVELGFGRRV